VEGGEGKGLRGGEVEGKCRQEGRRSMNWPDI